jgi:hypothetical protein
MVKMSKQPYYTKSLYKHLPKDRTTYVVVYKNLLIIDAEDEYFIQTVTNIYKYISNHKKEKIILLKYYPIATSSFDISILHNFSCKSSTNLFLIEDIQRIYDILQNKIGNEGYEPELNRGKNSNLNCSSSNSNCKFRPKNIVDVLKHLQDCPIYQFTLFGEDVPKHVRPTRTTVKKIINNNTTNNIITNNYQFNISVRQVGDYLRENLPDKEKIRILNSMDKIGEMVRQHFLFPEINRTLCVKNTNMYTGHSICFDGKDFVTKPNKDLFKYYILDLLDSCDYFADDFKKAECLEKEEIDRLIRNLDKYDSNIRDNDKMMREKIQKTIAQVKDLQGKI